IIVLKFFIQLGLLRQLFYTKKLFKFYSTFSCFTSVTSLIMSLLCGRMQLVRVGCKNSSLVAIASGIPQGSILGPILFSLCIGELLSMKLNGVLIGFADNT